MMRGIAGLLAVVFLAALSGCGLGGMGPFATHGDIGPPSKVGSGTARYDVATKTIRVTGAGANVWGKEDAMQFVWTKASGENLTLAADVAFDPATQGAIEHRKAMVMIRQSLDPDSAYADACVHGNGMTALQWRD